jgi:hypothetical protein
VVNFVSETVPHRFQGWRGAAAREHAIAKAVCVKGGHGNFCERMDVFFRHVGETNASSLMLGCAALGVLLLGKETAAEQARRFARGDRRHRRGLVRRFWRAWCEAS